MLKGMLKGTLRRLGYQVVGLDSFADLLRRRDVSDALRAELSHARAEMSQMNTDRVGYKNAYEVTSAELGQLRGELHGYKNAYDVLMHDLGEARSGLHGFKSAYEAVCTQLSDTQCILRQNRIDPEIVKEAARQDPPVRRRVKDDSALLAEVAAEVRRQGLPEDKARILLDPEFSLEDRSRYMALACVGCPPLWDKIAAVLAKIVNAQYVRYQPRYHDQAEIQENARTLRTEGLVRLKPQLDSHQVRETQDYFLKRPIFNGHIPMSARHRLLRRYVNYTADDFPIGSYSTQETALAPHLLEVFLSPYLLDTAAAYLGCAPQLTWLQSWWNFKGPGNYGHGQNHYHRDSTDFGMFWVYTYLTDVDAGAGPHKLIRRSGDFEVVRERYEAAKKDPALAKHMEGVTYEDMCGLGHALSDDMKEAVFDGLVETLTGPAGTMFISRGVDYHRVFAPLARKRQIHAARFVINEFPYLGPERDGDKVPCEVVADRVGSDDQIRYVTHRLFDWHPRNSDLA